MSRVDLLPGDRVVELLKSLEDDAEQFKNSAFISGRAGYLVQTSNTWDATATVVGPDIVIFTVTYTSQGSHPYPFTHYLFDLFIDVPNDEAHRIDYGNPLYTSGGNTAALLQNEHTPDYPSHDEAVDGTARRTMLETATQMKWQYQLICSGTITYYFKAYTFATDQGSLGVVVT